MPSNNTPPPALNCARLLSYAVLDSSVEFAGHSYLFVDGKELGAVPCLAICQDRSEVLLFHCSTDWSALGCSAHQNVAAAKTRAESIYHGVAKIWVEANVSEVYASDYLDNLFGELRCAVCGRRADSFEAIVQKATGWLCNRCAG